MLTVTIETGNEAMSEPEDIAAALRHAATAIEDGYLAGPIIDGNGNTVGGFNLDEQEAA